MASSIRSSFFVAACLCAGTVFANDRAHDSWPVVTLDQDRVLALSRQQAINAVPRTMHDWQARLDQPLRQALEDHQSGRSALHGYRSMAAELVDGDRVLVEVVYDGQARQLARSGLQQLGASIVHDIEQGSWLEAWLPLTVLPELARWPGIHEIRTARLLELDGGGTTSEGLAAGQVGAWHAAGLNGSGFTIAIFDRFANTDGEIAALQQSGDWPPDARLSLVKVGMTCGPSFGSCGNDHGNAVLEIAHDIAPGANYIAYDVATIGDWISATQMAIDAGAHILSASLSAPRDGIGDGSALPGSVAEAQLNAVAANRIPITSAGNSRQRHWGGLYSGVDVGDSDFADAHQWAAGATINYMGTSPGAIFCIPNGATVSAEISWNDWEDVDNDYVLALYRIDGADVITRVAVSDRSQNGSAGQTPQEWITTQVHTDTGWNSCQQSNQAGYGWRIYRRSADGSHNFRLFAEVPLTHQVAARSLTHPGDTTGVMSIAAISTAGNHASLSSEGPILAPGGGLPAGDEHPQPSLASFSPVTTTSRPTMGGTSAATPHVAGMAALLWHRHSSFMFFSPQQIIQRLKDIAVTGSNDLGAPGHDFQHGWGRLRFQLESEASFLVQPSDTVVGQLMNPNPAVEIRDDEGLRVLSGPTRTFDLELGADPSGGQATLQPNLIWHVLDGLTPFGGLNLDRIGEGYTLIASSPDFNLETDAFDIVAGASLRLEDVNGLAGGNVNMPFHVDSNAIGASALQFDAFIDSNVLELRSGGNACGFVDITASLPDHDVQCNDLTPSQLRVAIGGLEALPVGRLLDLRLAVKAGANAGDIGSVSFSAVQIFDAEGSTLDSDAVLVTTGIVGVIPTASIELEPGQIDFGTVDPANVPVSQVLTVRNDGTAGSQLSVDSANLLSGAAFSITDNACAGSTLAAGQSCQIEITLTHVATGTVDDSLLLATSGASNNDPVVSVQAELLSLPDALFEDRFEDGSGDQED